MSHSPTLKGPSLVHVLKYASYLIGAVGLVLAIAGWILDLDQMYILIGVLLAWAGFVKVVVVAIWTKVAMMGTEDHRPIAGQ